jgi:translation initiation factor 1
MGHSDPRALADWAAMARNKKNKRQSLRYAPIMDEPNSVFGELSAALAAQGLKASAESTVDEPSPPPTPSRAAPPPTLLHGKAVVRQERKGRGGKTVTVVDGAAIARLDDVDALAKTMRKALGTGARVENGKIVLQGDQRKGAGAWLEKQGAKVVIGN